MTRASSTSRWTIAADRYVATFGFCPPDSAFGGALSCRSLTRDGVELLAGPGAPLVLPWMGRLSGWAFAFDGERIDLEGDPRVRPDEHGRPLHGLTVEPAAWRVDISGDVHAPILVATAEPEFGAAFPWPQRVTVVAGVDASGLTVRTSVDAVGGRDTPVALGWHPYLRAPGTAADASGVEVFLPFTVACDLDAMLPTGEERTVEPGWVRDPVVDLHWRASPGLEAVVRSGAFDVTLGFGSGFGWAMTWVPDVGAGFVCVEPMAAPLDPFRGDGGPSGAGVGTPRATAGDPWVGEFALR